MCFSFGQKPRHSETLSFSALFMGISVMMNQNPESCCLLDACWVPCTMQSPCSSFPLSPYHSL